MLNTAFLALLGVILITLYSIRRDFKTTNENIEALHETLIRIETFLDSSLSLMQMQDRNDEELQKKLVENTKLIKENLYEIQTQNDLFIGCYIEKKRKKSQSKVV